MAEWTSEINGKALRGMIKEGVDGFEILKELYRLVKYKLNITKDEDLKYELEDLYYNIESDVKGGREEFIKWLDGEGYNLTEIVDDRLTQFYDLCDRNRIWVAL